MKKILLKTLSILVCMAILFTAIPFNNSVFAAEDPKKFIKAEPQLFDPSVGEKTDISWNFEIDHVADIMVMNGNNVIDYIAKGRKYEGKYRTHHVEWDGKDSSGKAVKDGTYTIVVEPQEEVYKKYKSVTDVTVLNANGKDIGITPNAYGNTFKVFGKGGENQGISSVKLDISVDGKAATTITATVDKNTWYADLSMAKYSLYSIKANINGSSGNVAKSITAVRHVFRVADRVKYLAALYYGDYTKAPDIISDNNIPQDYSNDGKLVDTNILVINPSKTVAQDLSKSSDSQKQHLGIIDQLQRITSANPSNLTMGNNFYANPDISIDGYDSLFFNRMYNSMSYSYNEFGINWSNTYTYYLQDMDKAVAILFEDGHAEYYIKNSDGSYKTAEGLSRKLVKNSDGSYTLTIDGSRNFNFSKDGKLAEVKDLNGNTLTLTYTGDVLTKVVNDSGYLTFSYNADGTISGVADNVGRTVSYGYSNGLVSSFTDVNGSISTYQYDSMNRLTKVVSAGKITLVSVEYDSSDRVVKKTVRNLGTYQYSYDDQNRKITGTEPNGNKVVYSYTQDYRLASEQYSDGTVKYYYKDSGNASKTSSAGTPEDSRMLVASADNNEIPGLLTLAASGASQSNGLELDTHNMNTATGATTNNTLYPQFRIKNTGKNDIALSDITLRYYYTIDGEKPQNFWCDWSSAGSQNVTGKFVKLDAPFEGADYYLELGFKSAAGKITAGKEVELHVRIAKNDWSNFTPGNDYSQNLSSAFSSFDKVDMYYKGGLVWGKGSAGSGTPADGNSGSGDGNNGGSNNGGNNGGGNGGGNNSGGTGNGEDDITPSGNNKLKLQMYNTGNSGNSTNTIHPMMRLINTGKNMVKLEDIKIRYYYTADDDKPQNFWCDWSSAGPQNITGTFKKPEEGFEGADTYLEVGFKPGSGYINIGEKLDIHIRIAKNDWSNYDITNDYSINPSESFKDWDKVDIFIKGEKVWGKDITPVEEEPDDSEEHIDYADTTYTPVRAEMFNTKTENKINFLAPRFRIYNTGSDTLKLSDINIKYFYTADGEDEQVFEADWAAIGGKFQTTVAKGDITCSFTEIGDDNLKTNCVANIGFTRDDIEIKPGEYLELHTRIHRKNWTNYLQTNDYSLNKTGTDYEEWNKIAVFVAGRWAWGSLPITYAAIADPDSGKNYTLDSKQSYGTQTDKAGNSTYYTYDANGNITSVTDAPGNKTTYTYNAFNEVTSETDALGNKTVYEYDPKGNMISYTDPMGNKTGFEYDGKGRLTKITAPDGSTETRIYDEKGNVRSSTDANGNTTNYEYDSLNRVTKLTDPRGNAETYEYTPDGKLKSVRDALGNTYTTEYNTDGQVTRETDKNGNAVLYKYSGTTGMLEEITDALNNITKYEYDVMGMLKTVTAADGGKTGYEYDAFGRTKAVTDANGGKTLYTYDVNGNLAEEKDPKGNATKYAYDKANRLTAVTDALNNTTKYEYDALGQKIKETDPKGNATGYTYDKNGRLTAVTDALGNTTKNEYNTLGLLRTYTDANGNKTEYEYDAVGNRTKATDPRGNVTQWSYDKNGNLEKITDALNNTTAYTYDSLNRLTEIKDAKGNTTAYKYDANGNTLESKDAKGNTTGYQYNALNQLTQVTNALGQVTKNSYDKLGNLEETNRLSKDGTKNQTTKYQYDKTGLLTKMTDAAGKAVQYEYDKNGQVAEKTDKDGKATKYEYDGLGNVAKITFSDNRAVNFTYDKSNLLQTIKDWNGTTAFAYDALGRTTSVKDYKSREVKYTWTKDGQKQSITYPGGGKVQYEYDTAGNLAKVTDADNKATTYTYDTLDRLKTKKLPNGTETQYTYDSMGQVTERAEKTGNTVRENYTYTYDSNGNRTRQVREAAGLSETTSYVYDALNELTEVTDKNSTRSYSYDDFNNRASKEETGKAKTTYQYNSLNQLTEEQQGQDTKAYSYDSRGNLAQVKLNGETKASYTFDTAGMLSKAETDKGITEYKYDGQGNRINVKVTDGSVKSNTDYVIDPETAYNDIIMAVDSVTGKESSFTYGEDRISVETGGTTGYYITNEINSITAILDSTGNQLAAINYDEFGVILNPGAVSTNGNIFAYTGHVYDDSTGFHYAKARYYNPTAGRFISEDTYKGDINDPVSLNLYTYVENNPINFVDPSGYTKKDIVYGITQRVDMNMFSVLLIG